MTGDELRAVRDAEEREKAKAPPPPKPHELDVLPRLKLNVQKLQQVKAFASTRGVSAGEAAVTLGHATEDDLIAAEAELTAGVWMSKAQLEAVQPIEALPEELCRAMMVLPVAISQKKLTVAMRDPLDRDQLKTLAEHAGGWSIVPVRAGPMALLEAITRVTTKIDEDDPSSWLER